MFPENSCPPIYFFIPRKSWPSSLPESADRYWQWQNETQGRYRLGRYNWTLQTYLHLKSVGFPCQLIDSIPDAGIVIAHRDFLPLHFKPSANILLVCIQADRPRHPYAQLHVVQNPQDAVQNSRKLFTKLGWSNSYYISNWPQAELVPRQTERGDRFENVGYFGVLENLASQLQEPAWQQQLEELGFKWHIVPPERWNDYQEMDAIVAVRSFEYQGSYLWKPASKLINAWLAGVPAILGRESAFRNQRISDLDYIEVESVAEIIAALKQLRDEPELRRAMVENGHRRSVDVQPQNITAHWVTFLEQIAIPAYSSWVKHQAWKRPTFLVKRYLTFKLKSLIDKNSQEKKIETMHWN